MSRYVKNNAILIFSDGTFFKGKGIGAKGEVIAEICFNTSLTGYQEILTDPSYKGQIVTFTFPHIGNVGTNDSDIESIIPQINGLIIREDITHSANYRSDNNLNDWLIKNNLTGICFIDTRNVVRLVKKQGPKNVAIIYADDVENVNIEEVLTKLNKSKDLKGVELASKASLNKNYQWSNEGSWNHDKNEYNHQANVGGKKIIAIDYGLKLNILRCLQEVGFEVEVIPAKSNILDILKHNPSGVFLSNGPGDPFETSKYATSLIKDIIANDIPLFGICLGHQLLALAMGASTIKMKQGHRGGNHPVLNLKNNRVEITSQNHGFCVDKNNLPENLEVTHISLFDKTIEGIKVKNKKAFSVQYHPESSPGPSDSFYLFKDFYEMIG
jgi:carbamoyl-phosphate synthase small subunit